MTIRTENSREIRITAQDFTMEAAADMAPVGVTGIIEADEAICTGKLQRLFLSAVAAVIVGIGILLVFILTRGCGAAAKESTRVSDRKQSGTAAGNAVLVAAARIIPVTVIRIAFPGIGTRAATETEPEPAREQRHKHTARTFRIADPLTAGAVRSPLPVNIPETEKPVGRAFSFAAGPVRRGCVRPVYQSSSPSGMSVMTMNAC